jgi:putative MFS transporter
MARLGGLLAPTAVGWLVVTTSFATAIAAFAALLLVAAVATIALRSETRAQPLS